MRREGVSLLLREDVEEVVVSRRDLTEQIGIGGGREGGGEEGEGKQVPARTEEEGRGGRGEEGGGEGEEGKGRQVEVHRGEANVRTPVDQLMLGLWRCSQGNPSTSWK